MVTFTEHELSYRKALSTRVSDSLKYIEAFRQKNHPTCEPQLAEIHFLTDYLNYFTDHKYNFTYGGSADSIRSGDDVYFFINTQHSKPNVSTFQNATNQPLSFLLNYALYEYNIRFDQFSYFHIKLDQIANKTFNRESEHNHLNNTSAESIEFVRDLCLKQQYILDYLSNLSISRVRLRGDSCVANIDGVSFQLAWYFSMDRLVFTLSFAVNNIFYSDYNVEHMSEFLPILLMEIRKNNFKTLFSKEQSYFFYQYLSCHNHSIHLDEFQRVQLFIQEHTDIFCSDIEAHFIRSFDNIINTAFRLGRFEFILLPSTTPDEKGTCFYFSNGASVKIINHI